MAVYLRGASVGHSHTGLTDTAAYRDYSGSWCFSPLIPLASQGKTSLSLEKKGEKLDRKFQSLILDFGCCRFRNCSFFHPLQVCHIPERCTAHSADKDPGTDTLLEPAAKPA